jgi:hypothetical protein
MENKYGFKISVNRANVTVRGHVDSFEQVVAEILALEETILMTPMSTNE